MARMKLVLLLAAACCAPIVGQEDLWRRVSQVWRDTAAQAREVTLPLSQQEAVAKLLKTKSLPRACDVADPKGEWLKHLRYRAVPISPSGRMLLAEAGPGCARGGQGSNGTMWLIRFAGPAPILLAGLEQGFDGYLYSVEPDKSKQFRDVILGWHMSGSEAGLSYFRFDGTLYRRIARATLHYDEHGDPTITPR